MIRREDALHYHLHGRRGKIEVVPSKPCLTQRDLSLAYTPGVAEPCREIERDPKNAYLYTARGNLVAVVSNGTAVLGLGDIGALAGKPVMEGKGVLFKRFADIDVFDIEIDSKDPEDVIKAVKLMEPTFGGINLEDIKAPECFYIEKKLKEIMSIPVFHDDQHGTAIISGAALLNAIELVNKDIKKVKVVFCGAGAAGIACAKHYIALGVNPANVLLVDSIGVIYKGRTKGMNPYKEEFAVDTKLRTLADAMAHADVFCGVSVKDMVTKEMIASMNDKPIVFAMANPDPEITYDDAVSVRDDLIMATGRSDFPNQVNNVLGFPFIFRGALDVRAKTINDAMKIAATRALASLAKENVPESVSKAYDNEIFKFSANYIIPKPFDQRVLLWESAAVAEAAMKTGVAEEPIDIEEYKRRLKKKIGTAHEIMSVVVTKAQRSQKKVVFPEGEEEKILRASQILVDERICTPILLGKRETIEKKASELDIDLREILIVDPNKSERFFSYAMELYNLRNRKGITLEETQNFMIQKNYFGSMMVHTGDADGMVNGLTQNYPDTIRPALQIIGARENVKNVAGLYIMIMKNKTFFFADATINIEPNSEALAEIAVGAAETAKCFDIEPKIAMLSFSNFGSTKHPLSEKVRIAVEILKKKRPDLVVDGEMQADTAVVPSILKETYPFSKVQGDVNVLVFPDLQSGNIAYKLLERLGGSESVGPLLLGMRKPVNILQRGATVNTIVHIAAITAVEAQGEISI